jgi:hypothetical protein
VTTLQPPLLTSKRATPFSSDDDAPRVQPPLSVCIKEHIFKAVDSIVDIHQVSLLHDELSVTITTASVLRSQPWWHL